MSHKEMQARKRRLKSPVSEEDAKRATYDAIRVEETKREKNEKN